jgi:hypothetical protein
MQTEESVRLHSCKTAATLSSVCMALYTDFPFGFDLLLVSCAKWLANCTLALN